MKRGDVIRQLNQAGCVLKRNGGRHDIFVNAQTGKTAAVPRHSEIKNTLVAHIKKQLGI